MGDRLIFMAKPGPDVLTSMQAAVETSGVRARLRGQMFSPQNWHQSLSSRYSFSSELRTKLLRAGERVRALAFELTFDQIANGTGSDVIHYAFLRGKKRDEPKKPAEMKVLQDSIRKELDAEDVPDETGNSMHVTISYHAAERLPKPIPIKPIVWTVDTFLLVEGGGNPYHYETIGAWPLLPNPDLRKGTMELFPH